MKKKNSFLLFALFMIIFAGFLWFKIPGDPLKKPLGQKMIYQHRDYTVLVQNQKIIVKGKGLLKTREFTVPENKLTGITRLGKKPKNQLPIKGVALEFGLLITGERNIYVLDLLPQSQIRLTYPNPGTKKNKILITKKTNQIYLYNHGYLVKTFPVATGKEDQFTPEGNFKIMTKTLYPKGKGPDSQLGARWMGLGVPYHKDNRENKYNPGKVDPRAPKGLKYGIHGTNEPDSIGSHASGGCIRLRNEDIIELFDLVPLGTEVEIKD